MNTSDYRPTIGLEIHVELKTASKMFCSCKNAPHESTPNTHICPVCLAHPGTLPTLNKKAIEHVLTVGTALGSTNADFTEFDRKNYFYPDIPKAYQISQDAYPLVRGGELLGIEITRIHLEEDTARSSHDEGDYSLVDYNRAGVPLMELVTEPVIHDAQTAGSFARELQLLLKTLGVADAHMEKGEMRVEANVSVSKTDTLGTKTEIKNLNSFKSVERAIDYEIKRHISLLESGGIVDQETRGWDEVGQKTFTQRKKESSLDYRYFPDPDLPKLKLTELKELSKEALTENLPELPDQKRDFLSSLGLKQEDIELFVTDAPLYVFFKEVVTLLKENTENIQRASNYILSDLQGIRLSSESFTLPTASHFSELIEMIAEGTLSSRGAKDTLILLVEEKVSPREIAEREGLIQKNDDESLRTIIVDVIKEHATVVAEFKSGNENVLQFLIGQGMKLSRGSANPAKLKEILEEELSK